VVVKREKRRRRGAIVYVKEMDFGEREEKSGSKTNGSSRYYIKGVGEGIDI
jgi:hypothetical protein